MYPRLLISLFLIIFSNSIFAQQKKKESKIDICIYSFAYVKNLKTVYLKQNKKSDPHEIRLSNANILGPFKTTIDEERNIFVSTIGTDDEGKTIYPPIGHAKIPNTFNKPLLILLPSKKPSKYKVLVLDRGEANFPEGSYKFINFSPFAIRGLIGKTSLNVKPDETVTLKTSKNTEDLMNVHFQYKRPEQWKTFGRTIWVNDRKKRGLLCSYVDPRSRRMKIRALPLRKPIKLKTQPPKKVELE